MRGAVLEQMLTHAPWRDAMQHQGLRIVGARVTDGLDLSNAHVASAVTLGRSRIEGDVTLSRAHFDSLLSLDGSTVVGGITATGMASESDVSLSDGRQLRPSDGPFGGVDVQKTITLRNARIKGSLYLNGGHFQQTFYLTGAHVEEEMQTSGAHFKSISAGSMLVGGKLSINATHIDGDTLFPDSTISDLVDATDSTFGGKLSFFDSRIAGDVMLGKSPAALAGGADDKLHITGAVTLAGARVNGTLVLSHVPFGGSVSLRAAHVVGDVQMDGATVAGALDVLSLQVDGDLTLSGASLAQDFNASNIDIKHDLTLNNQAHFASGVNLFDAHVANSVHMERATFDKPVLAPNMQVAGDMWLNESTFSAAIGLASARIGGDLQLSGAHIAKLDLTGATITGALVVSAATTWLPPAEPETQQLLLVNARVGGIQDGPVGASNACPTGLHPPSVANGWPVGQTMELDGFTYGHLGSSAGVEGADMRERPVCWWRWWLERDPDFSSQPYVQLASVMTAHGDQDSAADVLYYGRVRETRMAWESGHYPRWMLLGALNVVTGYGIGTYTFRALVWIIVLTIIGVVLLTWSPGGGQRTWLWRTGASLARVLPGIEINKEFTDFFNDPKRRRLKDWHVVVFSAFVVIGWVLGLFLVAAMSGLTQHS
jgi:hypothetical protein